jgi:hypothetical protein
MRFASNQEAWDAGYAIRQYSLSDASDDWLTPTGMVKTIGCPTERAEAPCLKVARLSDIYQYIKPKAKP